MEILVHVRVAVSEGVGELREMLLAIDPFDVDLRAYEFFFCRAPESEDAAGRVDDTVAAEVAGAKLIIRTGEARPYSNVVLCCGARSERVLESLAGTS